MTDILLPPALDIAGVKPRYIDNTGITTGLYTGAIKTAALGGDKLGMSITFTQQGGTSATGRELRAMMQAFMARLRGRQNRFYFPDPSYVQRGSFPTSELVGNAAFALGTTGWSGTGSQAYTVSSRVLRSTLISVSAGTTRYGSAMTVVNGAAYAARYMVNAGKGAMAYRAYLGTTPGNNNIVQSPADRTTDGLETVVGIASGTSLYTSLYENVTGRSGGDFQQIALASVSRCARINGGVQTGSGLLLQNLPASTDDVLMAGDQIEVITSLGSEIKILTAALNSDSSGYGYARFEPQLRGATTDGYPVIIYRPMGRWVLSGQSPEWANQPGIITNATLDFMEAAIL